MPSEVRQGQARNQEPMVRSQQASKFSFDADSQCKNPRNALPQNQGAVKDNMGMISLQVQGCSASQETTAHPIVTAAKASDHKNVMAVKARWDDTIWKISMDMISHTREAAEGEDLSETDTAPTSPAKGHGVEINFDPTTHARNVQVSPDQRNAEILCCATDKPRMSSRIIC